MGNQPLEHGRTATTDSEEAGLQIVPLLGRATGGRGPRSQRRVVGFQLNHNNPKMRQKQRLPQKNEQNNVDFNHQKTFANHNIAPTPPQHTPPPPPPLPRCCFFWGSRRQHLGGYTAATASDHPGGVLISTGTNGGFSPVKGEHTPIHKKGQPFFFG